LSRSTRTLEAKKSGACLIEQWNDWKKRFEPVRDRFRERYGATSPEVYESFQNVPVPDCVEMPATEAANIAYGIDIGAIEAQFADWAAGWAEEALRVSNQIPLEDTEKLDRKHVRAEDAVRYYKLAQAWSAAKDVTSQLAVAEAAVAETLPLWNTRRTEVARAERELQRGRPRGTGRGRACLSAGTSHMDGAGVRRRTPTLGGMRRGRWLGGVEARRRDRGTDAVQPGCAGCFQRQG
jgi:hypothetical protein